MRHFLGGLRHHMIRILTRKKPLLWIISKEYHVTPKYKHLYPNKEDKHELRLRLTPIKKNLGKLAGGIVREVPMTIAVLKKKLRIIIIEGDDAEKEDI